MYTHETITAQTLDMPYIAQKSWREEYGGYAWNRTKIPPTSTPDLYMILTGYGDNPCRRRQPSAADLLADDREIRR